MEIFTQAESIYDLQFINEQQPRLLFLPFILYQNWFKLKYLL